MKKSKLSLLIIELFSFSSYLMGCENSKSSSDRKGGTCIISELAYMSEEEQFEKSNLVYKIKAGKQGNEEIINDNLYTIYYFEVLEVLKGNKTISYAYFRNDPNNQCPSIVITLDEELIEGKQYKLYLKFYNGKYFTTAGLQSIIEIE